METVKFKERGHHQPAKGAENVSQRLQEYELIAETGIFAHILEESQNISSRMAQWLIKMKEWERSLDDDGNSKSRRLSQSKEIKSIKDTQAALDSVSKLSDIVLNTVVALAPVKSTMSELGFSARGMSQHFAGGRTLRSNEELERLRIDLARQNEEMRQKRSRFRRG